MPNGESDHRRVALVIGSGAVKCAAALGLWKVLSREGIPLDLFVGCSGGSLFAATMALGFTVDECIETTRRLWNRKVTENMTNNLYRANYAFHSLAHHAEIVTILPDFDRPITLFDTREFPYVIAQGERAAEAQMPYLRRLLASASM